MGAGPAPGGFFVMAPGIAHFAMIEEDSILQVHAIGPWRLDYVNAADDPFVPEGVLERVRARASRAVTCRFTRKGAHVGFVVGPPWRTRCWAEDEAVEFLAARVEGDTAAPARQAS